MALLAVLYGTIERLRMPRTARSMLHGVAFGCGAVAAMTSPAVLVPGVIVDNRAIFIAAAGAFVGPVAAVAAGALAAAYRLWLGGAGTLPGLLTLAIALTAGLAWRYTWFKRRPVTTPGLVVLALAISCQNILILFLPVDLSLSFMVMLGASMTASAFFATLVLCGMMLRENRQIAREKSLLDEAFTDPLTSLPNRRAIFGAETGIAAASSKLGFVVLLIDVDHFKDINDRFGHDVGDAALCILSGILKDGSRDGDIVGRLGGEEFAVILPSSRAEEGMLVAERLVGLVRERRIVMPEADFRMTISIGLVHVRGHVKLEEALARADQGLYQAKRDGRDRVVAAPPIRASQPSPRSGTAEERGASSARAIAQRSV